MDDQDPATHDNTPGPPAHANNMQSSGEWLAQPPAMQQPWPYNPPSYPQYNPGNAAFFPTYHGPLQTGPYQAMGPSGPPLASINMNQYNMPAGSFTPASSTHTHNHYAPMLGSGLNPVARQFHSAYSNSAAPPPLGIVQPTASTHMQSFGAVNPWPAAYPHMLQQSENPVPYFSQEASASLHTRHNSQPNQHPQRNAQSHTRQSQTHRYADSTSTQSPDIVDDRTTPAFSFSNRRRTEHPRGRRLGSARITVADSRSAWTGRSGGSAALYPGHHQREMTDPTRVVSEEDIRNFQRNINARIGQLSPEEVRRNRALFGSRIPRFVVSKAALESLEEVKLKELPEGDRMCVICYNEYETKAPEGYCERPVRLPKCKHIFGDHCIRKWFKDSDSCPYCRDKLDSETKELPSSTRAFLDMMRIRGWTAGSAVAEDFYRRIMAGEDVRAFVSVGRSAAGRRPAPDNDEYDNSSRRTRQRRSSSSSVEQELPVSTQSRPSVRRAGQQGATPNPPEQASPTEAGISSNLWVSMGPAPPGSPSSIVPNAPSRYQSPARPAQSTVVHQPSSVVQPPAARQGTSTRNVGSAANSGAMPNPLRNSAQTSQILHVASTTPMNLYAYIEDTYPREQAYL